MTVDLELKVFTLNCWGIPMVSSNRLERMQAVADVLATGTYELICLQEVWSENDYSFLKDSVKSSLPYSHYFYSGVTGSGLCVFSKFPILDVFFHQWSVNGYVHKIQHGDWFGGKGIGLCRLKIKNLIVNLYTTHLHAEYDRERDEYLAHRVLQAFDTAQFIRLTSGGCDVAILGGDLNIEPSDLSYKILCGDAQLEDCYLLSGKVSEDCIGTNESSRNSYSDKEKVKLYPQGKRIDYIFFKVGPDVQVRKVHYELPLPDRVPNCSFSYSDHEAVSSVLSLSKMAEAEGHQKNKTDFESHQKVLQEGLSICNAALMKLRKDRSFYWMVSSALFVLLLSIVWSSNPPYQMHSTFKIILAVLSALMCFTVFMSSLWNRMEIHGITAGKLAMELAVSKLQNIDLNLKVPNKMDDQLREG